MFDEERNDDILEHYGMPRRSGRYPWGSGEDPYQHSGGKKSIRQEKARLAKQGYSNAEIAKKLDMSINQMNARIKTEKEKEMAINVAQANKLHNKGYGNTEIARLMSTNGREVTEANVRYWLQDERREKQERNAGLKNELKELVKEKSYIDVGPGTETMLGNGVSKSQLDTTLRQLKEEGYELYDIQVKSPTDSSKFVHTKVLAKPGTEWAYLQNNQDEIQPIKDYSKDGGKTFNKIQYPSSISSDRVKIKYAEEGGKDMDGVILIRPGCKDLSLGNSHYAQVRIAVDDSHYLKGMAMYSDDIPKGYDIVFNTNKHVGTPKKEVLKPLKDDKDLPFGSVIKADGQSYYEDKNGSYIKTGPDTYKKVRAGSHKDEKRYSLNAVNKLKEEGEWNTYSKNLSSQFLSKQHEKLIKQQLNLTYADKAAEFEEIKKLSNPVVKRKLLQSFAEDCDTSAVHLKASPLPGQNTKVILPLTCISDDKIYAPGYKNGEKVALVRHPHAGTFEIPVLTVDNNNRKARKILGNTPIDCVGITSKVAEQLSGADFDGDTVICIPLRGNKIRSRKPLKGLETFDPKEQYPPRKDKNGKIVSKLMTEYEKGIQMGKVSNLITDMTLQGAPDNEIERAVKHSMVVIDAQKHKLDYKRSYEENGIAQLEKRWQNQGNGRYGGASTLISRAKSETTIPEVKSNFAYREATVSSKTGKRISGIDAKTGKKYLEPTNRYYYQTKVKTPKLDDNGKQILSKNGKPQYDSKDVSVYLDKNSGKYFYNSYNGGKKKKVYIDSKDVIKKQALTKVAKMTYYEDARELSNGHPVEDIYANYANKMKKMGNDARREFLNTSKPEVNKSAAKVYKDEVDSLNRKLADAAANAPKERAANRIANAEIAEKKKKYYESGTEWSKDDLKKASQQALANARIQTGADKKSVMVTITDREWEAIQANAVSASTLERILANTDEARIKELATPKKTTTLSSAEVNKIKRMREASFTTDEIAEALGRSSSTINKYLTELK